LLRLIAPTLDEDVLTNIVDLVPEPVRVAYEEALQRWQRCVARESNGRDDLLAMALKASAAAPLVAYREWQNFFVVIGELVSTRVAISSHASTLLSKKRVRYWMHQLELRDADVALTTKMLGKLSERFIDAARVADACLGRVVCLPACTERLDTLRKLRAQDPMIVLL
jgi:hypothetical protein